MENTVLLVVGILISVIGVVNMTGNISTIHAYNRRKVREEDVPKYGRIMGIGTLIIGLACIIGYFLQLAGYQENWEWGIIASVVIGLGFMLYGQFRYNKGIF